jgi:cardiolipin synthase
MLRRTLVTTFETTMDLPNILTLSRILAIPLLVALLFLPGAFWQWLALLIYIAACVTDYFDGMLARQRAQESALGRFLDPIADKLLVASVILALVAVDRIVGWLILPALIILCREVLVSGLREFLASLQVSVPVSKLAKWKTTVQMVALGLLILGTAGPLGIHSLGQIGLWIAAALTLVTGYDYLRVGLRHMGSDEPGSPR